MATTPVPSVMPVPLFRGASRITFGEKPVPIPGPGELVVAVKANALCGSERGQFANGSAVTPGHEAAGIVAAAGPQSRVPVGTPGVIFLMDFCGECRSCRHGATNQCLAKRADLGFTKDGGYGPYVLAPEHIFFAVDPDLPLTDATMLLDVMGTSAHAIKRARLVYGDIESVAITGAGPVGLGVLAMCRILLGEQVPVLIADRVPFRLELAARLGGIPIDLTRATLQDGVREHTGGSVDLAVDASGKSAARQACLEALAKRGVLVCVGHGERLDIAVSAELIAPERAVLGSEYFRFDELAGNLHLLLAHRAYLAQIITHRFGPDRLQDAFELFWAGDTGKVVIEQ